MTSPKVIICRPKQDSLSAMRVMQLCGQIFRRYGNAPLAITDEDLRFEIELQRQEKNSRVDRAKRRLPVET